MESHELTRPIPRKTGTASSFAIGQTVIYPMMGKCTVVGLESKRVGGETLSLYKLEILKSAFSRSTRQDPAIWVPVEVASSKGLRLPLQPEGVSDVFKIFSSREYYFELARPWNQVLPDLEAAIRTEGTIGLAKVASYIYIVKRKQIVPPPEVNRFSEAVDRLLYRELSEASGEPIRGLEEKIKKMMRSKLKPDT